MSGKGLLKPQYNRVRTSGTLQGNSIWTNTIGQESDPQVGSNQAIEASIPAPSFGGAQRAQRMERAQQLIEASGFQPAITDYQGLLTLARAQGNLGTEKRGSCKLCGGMGHLTKQCHNFLSKAAPVDLDSHPGAGQTSLLPDPGELSDLGSSDFDISSSSDSGSSDSSSSSDSGSRKRKRSKDKKKKKEKGKKKSKKEKKEKKEKKSKKDKKERKDNKRSKRD